MRLSNVMRLLVIFLAPALAAIAQVDPEYVIPKENPSTSPEDLKAGEKVFLGQCASCHGPKGEGGKGAVLSQPRLRHASDEPALFLVIRDGIKGTDMPGGYALTTHETWQVAAYVRSLGRMAHENVPGDAQRGLGIYRSKGGCGGCHIVAGEGGSVGPELTEIGARRSAVHLRAVLMDPEKELPEGFLQVMLVTSDGRNIRGVRLNEDTFTIQVRDMGGHLYSFVKQDLKELHKDEGKSPMPSFKSRLSAAEMDDLVAYLASLRGKQ
jgi:cytochrome c oxidase cbb3-type subunit III